MSLVRGNNYSMAGIGTAERDKFEVNRSVFILDATAGRGYDAYDDRAYPAEGQVRRESFGISVKQAAIAFAVMLVVGLAIGMFQGFWIAYVSVPPFIVTLATQLMIVNAVFMPMSAFANACYFTLRSGGKTLITFLFDSVSLWAVSVPVAFILSRYTDMYIVWMVVCVQASELVKCVLGLWLVRKGIWVRNIVSGPEAGST